MQHDYLLFERNLKICAAHGHVNLREPSDCVKLQLSWDRLNCFWTKIGSDVWTDDFNFMSTDQLGLDFFISD